MEKSAKVVKAKAKDSGERDTDTEEEKDKCQRRVRSFVRSFVKSFAPHGHTPSARGEAEVVLEITRLIDHCLDLAPQPIENPQHPLAAWSRYAARDS